MSSEFDAEKIFGDHYLYFYEALLSDQRSDEETERICSLGPVEPGDRVRDLACGHGRIANRLAERGAVVTGYDLTAAFLEIARADAERRQVKLEYVQGDMRELVWSERFDLVISWFTSFGYFDDAENRRILEAVRRALRPAGRFLLELNHGPGLLAGFLPFNITRRGEDFTADQYHYDALTGRAHNHRTVVREGRVQSFHFSNRVFSYPELRDWLIQAGFREVEGFGSGGEPLTQRDRRMIVRAVR